VDLTSGPKVNASKSSYHCEIQTRNVNLCEVNVGGMAAPSPSNYAPINGGEVQLCGKKIVDAAFRSASIDQSVDSLDSWDRHPDEGLICGVKSNVHQQGGTVAHEQLRSGTATGNIIEPASCLHPMPDCT